LRERIFPKNLAEVEPGWLYRSGQIRPNLIEDTLRDLDIDVILDLSHDHGARDEMQLAEKRAAEKLGIEIRRFPMNGTGVGEIDDYAGAIAEIARADREGRRVLVHCRAGDRRTGGVIAAYEMLVQGRTAEWARAELERFSRRRGVETNLTRFLGEHLDEIAQRLVEIGVIARLPDPMPGSPRGGAPRARGPAAARVRARARSVRIAAGGTAPPPQIRARTAETRLAGARLPRGDRRAPPRGRLLLYAVDLHRATNKAQYLSGARRHPTCKGMQPPRTARAPASTAGRPRRTLADADRALAGLEALARVTGRRGLLARHAAPAASTRSQPDNRWFRGGPGWAFVWRGDVSRDQYANGLLPALAACRAALPRARARSPSTSPSSCSGPTCGWSSRRPRHETASSVGARAGLTRSPSSQAAGVRAGREPIPTRASRRRDRLRDRERVVATSGITNVRVLA
jgi:protein-tyrosine phosphatase